MVNLVQYARWWRRAMTVSSIRVLMDAEGKGLHGLDKTI